jgi:acetolactate synthase small subunit
MSLNIIPSVDGKHAEMKIAAIGNPAKLDQIIKQLTKLIDVYYVSETNENDIIPSQPSVFSINNADNSYIPSYTIKTTSSSTYS